MEKEKKDEEAWESNEEDETHTQKNEKENRNSTERLLQQQNLFTFAAMYKYKLKHNTICNDNDIT